MTPEKVKPDAAATANGLPEGDWLGGTVGNTNIARDERTQAGEFREYFLRELRCALLRVRLMENDVLAMGLGVKLGLISPELAAEHLADAGVLRLVGTEAST